MNILKLILIFLIIKHYYKSQIYNKKYLNQENKINNLKLIESLNRMQEDDIQIYIYAEKKNFKFFEDYINSINKILKAKIIDKIDNNLDIMDKNNIIIFMQKLPFLNFKIDTLNQNLSENKDNFLCIIAGYKDSLENNFFSFNEGLSRRFTFRYTIEKYSDKELKYIFLKMVNDIDWFIEDKEIPLEFFSNNYNNFKNMAGDIETLIFYCKIEHAKRIFCFPEQKKKFIYLDIKNGLEFFLKNKSDKKDDFDKSMYI